MNNLYNLSADELERWKKEHTTELEKANKALNAEVRELKRAEAELIKIKDRLETELRDARTLHKFSTESRLDVIPLPARELEDLELAEIVDIKSIESLMHDFYELTHIPIGLNDLKGNVLAGVGWQDICTRFHRVHPETCKYCVESDIKLFANAVQGKFKLYRCKNNMWDIATPIIVGERKIGIIVLGQFFFNDESLDYEFFRAHARKYGFDEAEYIAALEKVPRLSREVVGTGVTFLRKLANMISQLSYSNIELAQSLEERNTLVAALKASEKRERARSDELTAVLDSMPAAVWIAHDPKALLITGNRFSCKWLKTPININFSKSAPAGERPEIFKLLKDGVEIEPADMPLQLSAAGKELNDYEIDVISSDGAVRNLLGNARPIYDEQGFPRGSVAAFIDITERKRVEQEREITVSFLHLVNRSKGTANLVRAAVNYFREHSGLEAVGIRLKENGDYPYFETKGFPEQFVRMENSLCARDKAGRTICDDVGNPVLECMCGNVICGRFDPSKPFFTERGSFWTNSTTELLASTSDADRQARTRNRCNSEGYESVALIALRVGEQSLGLLQLNDRRKGQFSPEVIAMWERMADYLAVALAKSRAEENLRESEEKYRIVANNTFDWEFWLDPDGRFIYTSPSCERVTGYAAQEFMDNPDLLQKIIYPEDLQRFLQHQYDSQPSHPEDMEFRIVTKDNEIRWIHHLCQSLFDDEGNYAGKRGSNRDITERKSVEEILAFERAQLLSIFDGMDDVVYVTDPYTYEVLYANRAMQEKFGGELVGGICYHEFQRRDRPCDFCTNRIILKDKGKPCHWEYYNPMVDSHFMIMDKIIKWPDGRDVRFEIAKDITDRKKAEDALRLSSLYNRSLIEASLDPLVTIGFDGKIKDVNGATEQVTGYTRNELSGTDFSNYFTEPEKARSGYQQVFTKGKIWDYPLAIQHRDGHVTPVLYNASVYRDENGHVIGVFASARDITERKKAEAAFQKLHDNLEKLVKDRTEQLEKAYESLKESEKGLADAQRMAHIGNWKWNIETGELLWSDEVYRIFGLNPQECKVSYDLFLNYVHPSDRDYLVNAVKQGLNGSPFAVEFRIVLADGEERIIFTEAENFLYEGNTPVKVKGIIQDITKQKRAEKELEKINRIRIKEIHHRIKNNLQVISSLLDLQSEKYQHKECINNDEVLEAFQESQNRVLSMSLIHEELYRGEGTDKLDFSAYVQRLAENLFKAYGANSKNIRLCVDLEENSFFDMDTAIPLGIIVNELVSNSLKHAFNEGQTGEIGIQLSREGLKEENGETAGSLFNLTISDNGKGIPGNIEIQNLESLGLQLVTALVDQLDGTIKIKREHGTEIRITFNLTENKREGL